MLASIRPRISGPRIFSRAQSSGAFFRESTGSNDNSSMPSAPPSNSGDADASVDTSQYRTNKDLRNHPEIAAKSNPAPKFTRDSSSPSKQQLYESNLKQNNGSYKNNEVMESNGKLYKSNSSRDEQKALEPSVYVESYRIKGSWKKSYMFLRLFRKLPLNEAITQCHFSSRRMARDVGEMLTRGSKDAEKLGLKPEDLVVDQIWVGKDGDDLKRSQCKGRGRTGVITSPYVHVKAVSKPQSVLDKRVEWTKQKLDRKSWFPSRNFKIKEDYVQTANYKW